jgi:glucokinase
MSSAFASKDCYVGIDIGATYLKSGIVSPEGRIWAQRIQNVEHESLSALIKQILSHVQELRQADEGFHIVGVGVGVPALVSKNASHISISPAMPCLNGAEFKTQMEQSLQLPAWVENDANVGAYGEMLMGAAVGVSNFVYIAIGTRVGAAVVIDGKIFHGASGYAGELGHVSVDPEGKKCSCGGTGCLERYVSAPSIAQRVEERISLNPSSALQIITDKPVTAQDVSAAALVGDRMASVIIAEVRRYLGMAIANLINLLNVEMVVLGGGVIEAGDVLLKPTIEEVKRRALSPPYDDCKIIPGSLGTSAGVIGASLLARDRLALKTVS